MAVDGRGAVIKGYEGGSFVKPTILADVPRGSEIAGLQSHDRLARLSLDDGHQQPCGGERRGNGQAKNQEYLKQIHLSLPGQRMPATARSRLRLFDQFLNLHRVDRRPSVAVALKEDPLAVGGKDRRSQGRVRRAVLA